MLARRAFLAAAVFALGGLGATARAADGYPSRPVTIIVPFAAGGGPDIVGRRIASKLSGRLGVPVIIDNRDGAGGRIGTSIAARAHPDGYTLLLGTSSALALAPALYSNLTYDGLRSFAPVSLIVQGPLVFSVRSSLPIQDLPSLLAYGKQNPGKLNYGSAGVGSVHHLSVEMLQRAAGVPMTHIPYKGGAPAWTALASGEVDVVMDALFGGAAPALQAGKARAIAVTGSHRLETLPQTSTFQEQGVQGMDVGFWWGLLAPQGTPAAVVARLSEELKGALADPELKASFTALSLDLKSSSPDAFKTLLTDDTNRWRGIVKAAGITISD